MISKPDRKLHLSEREKHKACFRYLKTGISSKTLKEAGSKQDMKEAVTNRVLYLQSSTELITVLYSQLGVAFVFSCPLLDFRSHGLVHVLTYSFKCRFSKHSPLQTRSKQTSPSMHARTHTQSIG